ncbi:MAG: hypothetical protein N839_0001230 [Desulfofustis sp. PB-SRB1]|jgi:hypothetical protein|nr:hypothetical protein [Desulfofustis sp. PB-SRB1]MBM1001012.1 hypothetical protein [Desulfofustis sp. PB-SRB1]HBH27704.1 hypothetical protein [Desulfofustis sp.]HBH30454.1 hypothetical protein [Desulfofustis sp.]
MTTHIHPIAEVTQRGTSALIREMGVVDTIRFLNQFRAGSGDYTQDRHKLFDGLSAKEIINEIKAQRKTSI